MMKGLKRLKGLKGLVAIATARALCGCSTVRNPAALENKAYAVTRIVSAKVLQRHPEYRTGMETARADLETLSNAASVGLPQLIEIIERLPIDTGNDADTALYIEAGLLFFSDELGRLAISNPESARIAARGMARALGVTLGELLRVPRPSVPQVIPQLSPSP